MSKEDQPTIVPSEAKQVGDIRDRWSWVEPSVWTERMLTVLENGVKGGKWFSLIDKVYRKNNLRSAFERVRINRGSAGVDHQAIAQFFQRLSENLDYVSELLKTQRYRIQAIKRVWIPKPGRKEKRPLGIPTVRDRVIQTALRNVLEPIFERDFAEGSYGFRPQRGCKDALRRVDDLLKAGYNWVVDADLKSYFDTIPHDKLMERIKEKVADSRILELIEMYLRQEVLEEVGAWTPETGGPQGAVISPLLSNIYLDRLDHKMAEAGYEMVRYADDFVIFCGCTNKYWCRSAHHQIVCRIHAETKLTINVLLGVLWSNGGKESLEVCNPASRRCSLYPVIQRDEISCLCPPTANATAADPIGVDIAHSHLF